TLGIPLFSYPLLVSHKQRDLPVFSLASSGGEGWGEEAFSFLIRLPLDASRDFSANRGMWEYSKDTGWKPIDDFIEAANAKDSEKKWELCGFNAYADFAYGERETLRMTVVRRRQQTH